MLKRHSKPKWIEEENYNYFDVVIETTGKQSLGMAFKNWDSISSFRAEKGGVAKKTQKLEIGDEVVGVNFESLIGFDSTKL